MNIIELIQNKFPDLVVSTHDQCGDQTVVIRKEGIVTLAKFLKYDPELDFNMLTDLTCVDYLKMNQEPRFEMVYHFYSLTKNHRLRVKALVDEKTPEVETLSELWPIANWFEREVWDMFGIRFKNHPNLKRILLYEEFVGHPLRKDYPYDKRQPIIGPKN